MAEAQAQVQPEEFVQSEDEIEKEYMASSGDAPKPINYAIMSDSRSTISSTAISRTETPDESAYTFGIQTVPDDEKQEDPEKIRQDVAARGILRDKMELEGPTLKSTLVAAALENDGNHNNNVITDEVEQKETEPAEAEKTETHSAKPTILAYRRESDLIDTRPSSASSTSTQEVPVSGEQELKRQVSFHNDEEKELVQMGQRMTSFISRPGNLPVELSTTCTQTEWSWLKDIELYEEILSRKPEWVAEKKPRKESKSSAGSSKSSISRQRRKKKSSKRSSPPPIDKTNSIDKKESYKDDVSGGISRESSPLLVKTRNSLESPLPSISRDDDLLLNATTVELSSSNDTDDDDSYFLDEETLIPSIGPPAILQYIKESQHPPLTNEELEERDIGGEFLKKSVFSGPCMFCKEEVLPFPTIEEIESLSPEQLFCCPQYERFIKFELTHRGDESHIRDELIDIKPHPPYGTKAARRAAKERAAERAREREMERQKAAGNPTNFYALTRQMKTINYSLASTKCMEEGWTVKPRSPTPSIDGQGEDQFVIEVNPLQMQKRAFLERFYEDGQRFLLVLPDGTGCCYYPSGNIAVLITSTERGKFNYLVYEDSDEFDIQHTGTLASFDPTGHGTCYFRNGAVRLVVDPFGGVLLDSSGTRKKKWLWHNHKTHVHAPPFQPITFSLTKQLAIRCLSQNKIVITYTHGKHTAKFNVGSKLKAVRNLKPPIDRDEHELHLAEVKQFINILLDRTQNALRLPNYPRLDKIPLPQRLQKTMRREKLRPIRSESRTDNATVTVN
ncbi:predicted protein [Nematostella vectensis]|uniref:FAM194 C-terminal domain-containing protein n=1 Tax=Nematostella vectensis TaxID=45351 RepID=A7SRP5_NEMVE|nr:glutamate-rich protein 6 [Nematostella vectensis]EDO33633.1 predicted protein [Nematostella vectensis]|eukprot:XP_001625733.1 predicted protein [Nematostella vectensis]